jgi:hypothetical protein
MSTRSWLLWDKSYDIFFDFYDYSVTIRPNNNNEIILSKQDVLEILKQLNLYYKGMEVT